MDKNLNEQKIIKNIMEIAPKHCENCGSKYSEKDFQVMKNSTNNTLLHLKCSNCGNTYMLNIMSPMNGMLGASRVQLNLDLNDLDEISKFSGKTSTNQDEALDLFANTDKKNFLNFIANLSKSLS